MLRDEPELTEVMDDPIVTLLMKRDGVKREYLMPLLNATRMRMNLQEDERV
jgi:hypothetical protein